MTRSNSFLLAWLLRAAALPVGAADDAPAGSPLVPNAEAGTAADEYLSGVVRRRHIPALTAAVLHDGTMVKSVAFGSANLECEAPATPATVFQIHSITKTFTATAILLLAEEGQLALDDPISRHLDGTPDAWRAITLRHLLGHTSGLKDFINEPTASRRLEVTEDEVFRAAIGRPLNFRPGERWQYSNTNYHLLAMVIRRRTGKAYGDFLRERILAPLGMHATQVVDLKSVIPHRASGYGWDGRAYRGGEYVAESILGYGGGGLMSTAPDLVRWADAVIAGTILRRESQAQAWTPGRTNDGMRTGYGLGWGVDNVAGHREFGHGGGHITGFTSFLLVYPDDRLAIVVLTNRADLNLLPIARKLAGFYQPELAPRPEPAIRDDEPRTTELVREFIRRAAEGRLESSRFTPELWRAIGDRQEEFRTRAEALGALRTLEVLSRDRAGDRPTARYRAGFVAETLTLTVTFDAEARIADLRTQEEE